MFEDAKIYLIQEAKKDYYSAEEVDEIREDMFDQTSHWSHAIIAHLMTQCGDDKEAAYDDVAKFIRVYHDSFQDCPKYLAQFREAKRTSMEMKKYLDLIDD